MKSSGFGWVINGVEHLIRLEVHHLVLYVFALQSY